jgi:uncharacterized protein YkwD
MPSLIRPLLAAAAIAAFLMLPASALAADCPGQEVQPAAANLAQVEAATLCLLNAERTSRRLHALQSHPKLRTAAARHAVDMVQNDYFSHDSLDGRDFTDRIDRQGYIPRTGRWLVGENIGWGSGSLATAALMVNGWMNSPDHRANILDGGYREIGIGIAPMGAPGQLAGATYVNDFGARPGYGRKSARKARKKRRSKRRSHRRSRSRIIATINRPR